MQKIVYVLNTLASPGGIERIVIDKITYLLESGKYQVGAIVTSDESQMEPFFTYPQGFECKYALSWDSFVKTVREMRPDVLVFTRPFFLENALVSILFPKIHRCVELHACYEAFLYPEERFGESACFDSSFFKMSQRVFPYLEQLILLTDRDRNMWGYLNSIVIPNFTKIDVNKHPINSISKRNVALALGRMVYQKGFDYLIDAWQRVCVKHPNWQLVIYGDGPLRQSLQNQINNLGIGKYISLMGYEPNTQLVYKDATLVVMSSNYEGFPMVMIEALSNGIPVVSYDFPSGAKEMIIDGVNGHICKYRDVEDLSHSICKTIKEIEHNCYSISDIQQSIAQYSPTNILNEWDYLFERMLTHKHHRTCSEFRDSLVVLYKYFKAYLKNGK